MSDELRRFVDTPAPEALIEQLERIFSAQSLSNVTAAFAAASCVLLDRGVTAEALKAGIDGKGAK